MGFTKEEKKDLLELMTTAIQENTNKVLIPYIDRVEGRLERKIDKVAIEAKKEREEIRAEAKEEREQLNSKIDELRADHNELPVTNKEQHDEVMNSIGIHYNKAAKQEDHKKLEIRVSRVEEAIAA